MNNFVCADCGYEQDSMDRKCDRCRSIRVITIKVAEEIGGPNWRLMFTPEGVPEHELPPGVTYTKEKTDESGRGDCQQ